MYELLEGKSIVLRKAKIDDYESMLKHVWSDENVYKWMLYTPTFTKEDAIERCKRSIEYQKNNYAYFVALKDTNEAIGLAAIKEVTPGHFEESGICIGTKFQNNGIGKEILGILLDLVFNKLNAIDFDYGYFIDNIRSKKVALSYGFTYNNTTKLIRSHDNKEFLTEHCILRRENYIKK